MNKILAGRLEIDLEPIAHAAQFRSGQRIGRFRQAPQSAPYASRRAALKQNPSLMSDQQ